MPITVPVIPIVFASLPDVPAGFAPVTTPLVRLVTLIVVVTLVLGALPSCGYGHQSSA